MPNSTQTTSKKPVKAMPQAPFAVAKKSVTKPATAPVSKPPSKSPTTARKVVKIVPASKKVAAKTTGAKVTAVPAVKVLIAKPIKTKKIKLIRDSFTIPKPEYLILDNLKLRAADLKHPVKKSELLRAGIKALAAMADSNLLSALKAVPMLKTGRPSK